MKGKAYLSVLMFLGCVPAVMAQAATDDGHVVNTMTFVFDNQIPFVKISVPNAPRYNNLPTISGTAFEQMRL